MHRDRAEAAVRGVEHVAGRGLLHAPPLLRCLSCRDHPRVGGRAPLARRSNGRPRLEAIAPPTTVHRAAYTAYTVTC